MWLLNTWGFPGGASGKNLPAKAGDVRDAGPTRVGKIPWRREWQPTLVFLPGEFHRHGAHQRSLVGYNP